MVEITNEAVLKAFSEYPSLSFTGFAGHGIFPGTSINQEQSKALSTAIKALLAKGCIKVQVGSKPERWEITDKGRSSLL